MGFSEEMFNLGEKLLTSCENRINGDKEKKRNNRAMMNRFHQNNNEMSKELHNNLNRFTKNLSDDVNTLFNKFKQERKEMRKKHREKMNIFTQNLTRNVKNIAKNAKGFIDKCHENRMETHDMFIQAHKNFMDCMNEIEKKKRHTQNFRNEPPPSPRKKEKRKKTIH